MRPCTQLGCEKKAYARGLCNAHYLRARSDGTISQHAATLVRAGASLDERLRHHGWTVVDSDCWEWNGYREAGGYGLMAVGSSHPERASRAAYSAWIGPIPEGGVVCHRCDNPPCINPSHLFLGDRSLNNADMATKKRSANGVRKANWRLTDAQVDAVRERYAAGDVSQRALATEYGVSQQLISLIVARKRRADRTHASI